MQASAVFARDSFQAGGRVLGGALAIGLTVADVEAWPDRIAAVTKDQIRNAARHVFQLKHSVTSLLLHDDGSGKGAEKSQVPMDRAPMNKEAK